MEYGNFSRQSMPRLRGGQWASSEHCVQKVEEMLSRAIMQQENLLELLMSISLEIHNHNCCNSNASPAMPTSSDSAISPQAVRALKAKIENSVDWCQLALCRLREMTLHTSNASPGISAHGFLSSSYSKAGDGATQKQKRQQLVSSSARLNVPTPLSPLRVLLRTEPLSPHPFTVQSHSSAPWSPGNLLFTDSAPHLPSPVLRPGEDSSSLQQQQQQRQRWRQRHQQQGLNFARFLASLQMDTSEWSLFQGDTGPMRGLTTPLLSSAADPVNGEVTDHLHYEAHEVVREDQSYIDKTPTPLLRGNRSRNSSAKSEVRKWSGGEAELEVVFQKLNDTKKGIPDDGHRGWKKYGNKMIQNSNHCRGYYKCSVKECRAKKMVQPTDKDPTLFEVTYVGKHTCSSTGPRRRSSKSMPACIPAPVEVPGVQRKYKSAGTERENSRILTGSNSMTEEDSIRENGWTGIIPSKRARSMVEGDKASLDNNFSYLHTMTTSTTASEEQGGDHASLDTYPLHQSSHHHQVNSFQEPLLWHDFDMDTSLSTGHKSVSMDSDSP